jgi:hypothetical protein
VSGSDEMLVLMPVLGSTNEIDDISTLTYPEAVSGDDKGT